MTVMKLSQTTAAQRSELYEDLKQCISPGFLSHKVVLDDLVISLRSPFPRDIDLTKKRALTESHLESKLWMLASVTWLIDGYLVLGSPDAVPRLQQAYGCLPKNIVDLVYSGFQGLFHRYINALKGLESYFYETDSRYLWQTYSGKLPNSVHLTGIQGSDTLGLNSIQQSWIQYNRTEDQRLQDLRDWSVGKFVASTMNSKGVKHLNETEAQEWETEKSRRQEVQDRYYYYAKGITPETELRATFKPAHEKTVYDLEEEMRKWVAGELDEHDLVVQEYKDTIRKASEENRARIEEAQQKIAESRKAREDQIESGEVPTPSLVGYTPDQLAEFFQKGLDSSRIKKIYYKTGADYIFDKYLDAQEVSGSLAVEDGQLKDVSSGKRLSIAEELQRRKPTAKDV